ncbi:MAG: DUF882 domain-containing protein [Myxococcales bacterium]|nr:DUF882 domain-containing protein [Myxococcales bacterium]
MMYARHEVGLALLLLIALVGPIAPAAANRPRSSCKPPASVEVARVFGPRHIEQASLTLTTCTGQPNLEALDELSILARPNGTDRPESLNGPKDEEVADGILRLDARLLTRLQAIADRWPGHRFSIVSGYRPTARKGSRHRHGEAIDFQVDGVSKEDVVAFAKTIPGTGVGYYPNSIFTHVDVRAESYSWVDESGPGQKPRYTQKGPVDPVAAAAEAPIDDPAAAPTDTTAVAVRNDTLSRVREALAALTEQTAALREAPVAPAASPAPTEAAAPTPEPAVVATATPFAKDDAALTPAQAETMRNDALATVRAMLLAESSAPMIAPDAVTPAPVAEAPPEATIEEPTSAPIWDALTPVAPAPTPAPRTNNASASMAPPPTNAAPVDWSPPWES